MIRVVDPFIALAVQSVSERSRTRVMDYLPCGQNRQEAVSGEMSLLDVSCRFGNWVWAPLLFLMHARHEVWEVGFVRVIALVCHIPTAVACVL